MTNEFIFTVDSGLPRGADKENQLPFSMRFDRGNDFTFSNTVTFVGPDDCGQMKTVCLTAEAMDLIATTWLALSEKLPF